MNGPKVIDKIQIRCLSKFDYMLEYPVYPLCRKVRGGPGTRRFASVQGEGQSAGKTP